MSAPPITPVPDVEFSIGYYHEALELARKDPAKLRDRHIRDLAVYDAHGATKAWETRAQAIAKEAAETAAIPPAHTLKENTQQTPEDAAAELMDGFLAAWRTGDETAWKAAVRKHGDLPMHLWTIDVFCARALFRINERNRERNTQIEALEQRIAELEARPTLKFAGSWRDDVEYSVGEVVACRGAAWVCQRKAKGVRPGEGTAFGLLVKAGRDGHDLREPRPDRKVSKDDDA